MPGRGGARGTLMMPGKDRRWCRARLVADHASHHCRHRHHHHHHHHHHHQHVRMESEAGATRNLDEHGPSSARRRVSVAQQLLLPPQLLVRAREGHSSLPLLHDPGEHLVRSHQLAPLHLLAQRRLPLHLPRDLLCLPPPRSNRHRGFSTTLSSRQAFKTLASAPCKGG
eukprot:3688094-Rhodomonas_salina.2